MDVLVQAASLSQLTIMHTVALQTQKLAMDSAKIEGEVVMKMIDNLSSIRDSAVGGVINVLA